MDRYEVETLLTQVKGAPLSILFALLLTDAPLTRQELADTTSYSLPTVDRAIAKLARCDFLHQPVSAKQYVLTVKARQFILGESQPTLEADFRGEEKAKKFFTPTSIVVSTNTNLISEELLTTDSARKEEIFLLDEDSEETIAVLKRGQYPETLKSGKGGRDSVIVALESGWTGRQCYDCVIGWLEHSETEAGSWIKTPWAFAAGALRKQNLAPRVKAVNDDPMSYVEGEYGDLIEH